ncbi:MAG TPA: methionine adenosyltransferase domain-containing protein, partial [Candidatus Saccharimonadales bacterium]|nr:methionine adenosyltransferase domain-containing protein [Candidatus Saccharimonadales bacterium]
MSSYRSAESVSPKHPDKLCDQISDAILDAYLTIDPNARVAIEVAGGHGQVFVLGEVTAKGKIEIEPIVRRLAGEVELATKIVHQSPEIASGVDKGGAGDQGIMVGYAVDETQELMPLEVMLARSLNQFLYERWPYDGKTQVTTKDGRIVALVASFQNSKTQAVRDIIDEWLKDKPRAERIQIYVNPTGDWHQGGFDADSGLTGRKLVIDNYGPQIPVGGGAFSGKDPTKVDRSGAYMARRIAVDYLRKHNAKEVYCYLAYAIGVAQPLEAVIRLDGQTKAVQGYDLTPKGIIEYLDLKKPQYEPTARWGHFGHGFTWDNT